MSAERCGWCRYMVVLRSGGVYADMDVECRKPLNSLIMPRDTLIVGWENEFSSAEEARNRKYVRKRQVSVPAIKKSLDCLQPVVPSGLASGRLTIQGSYILSSCATPD